MQTNLGRNDPCHCGSGRKYKKCCLAKDEKARQAASPGLTAELEQDPATAKGRAAPEPKPDPRTKASDSRWSEFEAAGYKRKLDLFVRTLEDPELMDGEMAFEMLEQIFHETVEHRERDRFDALVESLRERRPEVYAEEAHYFLNWRIANALAAGRSEDVTTLMLELAPLAGKAIDTFNRIESQLAYHGHLSTLVAAMRRAWPEVKSSSDIVPWGIDGFCVRAMGYELLDYADHTFSPPAEDPALLERIECYFEIDPVRIAAHLAHLTGSAGRQWTMSDFKLAPRRRRSQDGEGEGEATESGARGRSGELNLFYLTVEFLGYLRRQEGVPYAKGELGRRELYDFIVDRQDGKLEYKASMLDAMQRDLDGQQGRRPPPKPKFRRYEHTLIPDPERLEHYLVGLLGMINQLYHRAAAFFEIIPAWLRFLETRRLIDAEVRARALGDLAYLADDLCNAFENYPDDPSPRRALEAWRAEAGKAIPE